MCDFILRNNRKCVWLMVTASLMACSEALTVDRGFRPAASITPQPINIEALAGHDLISFDIYVDGDVLHAVFAAAAAKPKQPYAAYLRSVDGGRHWSPPVSLGQYATANLESSAGNEIQIAASGDVLLVVWQVTGEIPGMGPLQSIFSVDAGQHWRPGSNPTDSEVDQSHPDLVADSQGRFHLVWLDDKDENGYQGVRYARTGNAGQSWELRQTIDESSCSCCWNRVLTGPDEQINVLYRDRDPRDMALAQSKDGGKNWRRASTVGDFNWAFDGCPHNGGSLAWARDRLQALVWTGKESKAGLYYLYSSDNGASWSVPRAMGSESKSLPFHSDIAALDDEHFLAIWDARDANGSTVMISESFDHGIHWSFARRISTPGSSAQFPRIVATPAGFLAIWVEQEAGAAKQWMSAIIH